MGILTSDTPVDAFKSVLRYLYSGEISLCNQSLDQILSLSLLCDKYGLQKLQDTIINYTITFLLSVENILSITNFLSTCDVTVLREACNTFIRENLRDLMERELFAKTSVQEFKNIFTQNSLSIDEKEVFLEAQKWLASNPSCSSADKFEILSSVRLPLISTKDLFIMVLPSNLYDPKTILVAIEQQRYKQEEVVQRDTKCIYNKNIAVVSNGTNVITGQSYFRSGGLNQLLDLNSTKEYDGCYGYAWANINDSEGITIDFNCFVWIDNIRFLLWDLDSRVYSYRVMASRDKKDWNCIVDRTSVQCSSWQDIDFHKTDLRFVRIVGTSNSKNDCFHVVYFEAKLKSE